MRFLTIFANILLICFFASLLDEGLKKHNILAVVISVVMISLNSTSAGYQLFCLLGRFV